MSFMMKILLLIIFVNVLSYAALAQKERKFVREGNDYFNEGLKDTAKLDTITFGKAEVSYRKALQIKPEDFQWQFNLADAIYKQKKGDQAATEFEKLADKTVKPSEKASVYYNLGNSLLTQKKFDPSIDAYKKALRITPNDPEAKYNLAFAEKMKKEDQKQKDKDKKDKDKDKKDKDKNKDQNKDQDKNKDQNKDNQNQDQNKDNQQNKPQQNKISKQSAEQMLQALENEEQKTQEKVKKAQVLKAERTKIDKNW
jgi:Ca-activated chloride channel family protein